MESRPDCRGLEARGPPGPLLAYHGPWVLAALAPRLGLPRPPVPPAFPGPLRAVYGVIFTFGYLAL